MRTLTMARILLVIGWLGTASIVATSLYRFPLVQAGEVSRSHVLLSFVGVLLAVLADAWLALFLVASGFVVRRTVSENSLDPLLAESLRQASRLAVPAVLAAALLSCLLFLLRSGIVLPPHPAWMDSLALVLTILCQAGGLVICGRAVTRNEGVLDDVATRLRARTA